MTTKAYAALQKQVAILTNRKAITGLNLRMLEIALEGMNVPPARRAEAIQTEIQKHRDLVAKQRAIREGGSDATP